MPLPLSSFAFSSSARFLFYWWARKSRSSATYPDSPAGEWLAAYALTEPGSGSDAGAMRTRAERRGDTYVLNGVKHFITNAGIAHVNTVFAVTDPTAESHGTSAFVVEADRPGFRMGKAENKMGIRGSQTGELIFEDCSHSGRKSAGERGRRLQDWADDSRSHTPGHRRAGSGYRPGRSRLCRQLCQAASPVRQAYLR